MAMALHRICLERGCRQFGRPRVLRIFLRVPLLESSATDPSIEIAQSYSIPHAKRRTVLGPRLAPVVEARGGDIGMAQPLLDLRDIGLMGECVSCCRGAQRMHT